MPEPISNLVVNEEISAREPIQVLALLRYVFTLNNVSVLSQIAETANPHNRGCAKIVDSFLTSTLPLAHRSVAIVREVNQ